MNVTKYNIDDTYFSQSHFYPSINIIIAKKKERKKAQLGCFNINRFCSAYKRTSEPSAKITIYFAFDYISFQVVHRANEWDLLGAQSLQPTFTNIVPSKFSSPHNLQASRITHSLMF